MRGEGKEEEGVGWSVREIGRISLALATKREGAVGKVMRWCMLVISWYVVRDR